MNTSSYEQFKSDVSRILNFNNMQELLEKICLLSWKVSFMPKKKRINEILNFIKNEKLKKIQEFNTLELILALSHLRRAKYDI